LLGRKSGERQSRLWVEWFKRRNQAQRIAREFRIGAFRQYRCPPGSQNSAFAAVSRAFHERFGVHFRTAIFAHVFKTFWRIP
jgi:hypothetical protein